MGKKLKVFRHIFRFHGFYESLKIAGKGIAYMFLFHRNMRIIFLCGVAAFLMGIYFRLRGIELVALCVTITLVFMAEMFNTAIELMIDISFRKYHTLIKLVKDIAAAVVLIAAINSLGVGYVLFSKHIIALLK
ncbi:MAG: diacylglycerol kinase [Candidatus Omnitrophota bacterium]